MILNIINTLIPVAFVICLGWFAGYKNVIDKHHGQSFANFIMNFSFPCLLFFITSTTNPKEFSDFKTVSVFALALVGMYFLTFLLYKWMSQRKIKDCAQTSFVCAFPDMAFMGIPILGSLLGPKSLVLIAMANIITSLFLIPFTTIFLESQKKVHPSYSRMLFHTLLNVFKKPLVIAPILGTIVSLLKITPPHLLNDSLRLIGQTTSGVSLFALGLIMSRHAIKFNKHVMYNIVLKNILHPLMMLCLVVLFNVKGVTAQEAILLCAMPTATMTTMFALRYRVLVEESTSSTVLGTIISVVTLPLFIILSQRF